MMAKIRGLYTNHQKTLSTKIRTKAETLRLEAEASYAHDNLQFRFPNACFKGTGFSPTAVNLV